jgi:CMP-N-acetylneuraminic acid synthetase
MICAILIGRKGSTGFPGKNKYKYFGRPSFEYPLIAAHNSKYIEKIYVNSDIPEIQKFKKKYNLNFITRKKNLASNEALGEDVFADSINSVSRIEKNKCEIFVLLFANAPTINTKLIDEAILKLISNPKADSAVTVNIYNMYSPFRARKIKNGFLAPFIPIKLWKNISPKVNCDRDSQGNVYFSDGGCSVVRKKNFISLKKNLLPMRWMGKKILPVYNEFGLDIDYKWQTGLINYWLKKYFKSK